MKFTFSVILTIIAYSAFGQFQDKLNARGFGTVHALTIDSAARELFVGSDRIICVFDLVSLRLTGTISIDGSVSGLVVTKRGELVTLIYGKIFRIDRSSKSTLLYGAEEIVSIQYDATTETLYAISVDGKLKAFRLNIAGSAQPVQTVSSPEKITSIALSSEQLAVGLQSGEILLYHKQKLTLQGSLKGHTAKIVSMSFSADGTSLASSSGSDPRNPLLSDVILWKVADRSIQFKKEEQHNTIKSVAVTGNRVVLTQRLSLKFLTTDGQPSAELATENNPILILYGQKLIYGIADTGMASRYLYKVDVPSAKVERGFTFDINQVWQLNFTGQGDLAITKDNEVTGIDKGGHVVFNERLFAHSSDLPFKNDAFMGIGLKNVPNALPDSIRLCDFKSGKTTGYAMPREILERRFSSDFIYDGKNAFVLTNKNLSKLGEKSPIIDFTTPVDSSSAIMSIINRDDFFNVVSPRRNFIPGSGLFYEYDPEAKVISLRRIVDATYIKQIKGYYIINAQTPGHFIVFHPTEKALYELNLTTFELKKLQEVRQGPDGVELSPDGTWMALKYEPRGNAVDLINLRTKETKTLTPSFGTPTCVAFSPNGKYLLMGTYSGEIKLWNLKTGLQTGCIFTSSQHKDYVILNDGLYDGTPDGIKYLILPTAKQSMKQVKNLFKTCLTD